MIRRVAAVTLILASGSGCQLVVPSVRATVGPQCQACHAGHGELAAAPDHHHDHGHAQAAAPAPRAPHSRFHPVPTRPVFEAAGPFFDETQPELAPVPWDAESSEYPKAHPPEEILVPRRSRPLDAPRAVPVDPPPPTPSPSPTPPADDARELRVTLNPPELSHPSRPAQLRWLEPVDPEHGR